MTQKPGSIVAVIPSYRPERSLFQLVTRLSTARVIVVADDSSPCTFDPIFRSITKGTSASVVRNTQHCGIARGLNQGLSEALRVNAEWLLTLDQDSTISGSFIVQMLESASKTLERYPKVKAVGPGRVYVGSQSLYRYQSHFGVQVVPEIIQSGAIWHVKTLQRLGGFDESLGMDAVDAEICLRLRENGYSVAIDPSIEMRHRLGRARTFEVLRKPILVTGHSRDRQRSMVRNRLHLAPREFAQSPQHAWRTLRRVGINTILSRTLYHAGEQTLT